MQDLRIQEEELKPGIKLVCFSGVLDMSGQEAVLELEKKIINYEAKTIAIFDFSDLAYLNSYAIGFIAHWYNHLKKKEGKILLVNPQKQVYDVLNVLGIANVLEIYDTVEKALEKN